MDRTEADSRMRNKWLFFLFPPTMLIFFHNGQTERRDKRKMKVKMGGGNLFDFFSPAGAESPLML